MQNFARAYYFEKESRLIFLPFEGMNISLTLFQLGRDNFYHRESISRDKA